MEMKFSSRRAFQYPPDGRPIAGEIVAGMRQVLRQQLQLVFQGFKFPLRAEQVDGHHRLYQVGEALRPLLPVEAAHADAVLELVQYHHQRAALPKSWWSVANHRSRWCSGPLDGHEGIEAALGIEKLVQRLVLVLPGEVPDIELELPARSDRKLVVPDNDVHALRPVGLF